MKIILVHGEDVIESRNRLVQFIKVAKKRNWDVIKINNKLQNIKEALSTSSLFGNQKLVIVEDINLFDKNTFDWIKTKTKHLDTTLIIYHKAVISKTFSKKFPKIDKNEEFKLPKLIWSLLDSFYPGNSKNILILLNKVTEKDPIEFVFSLLSKQLRDMYWVKTDPDTLNYPSWRKGKLKGQARKFPDEKIEEFISELAEIDVKCKTTSSNLKDLLDFAFITKLE